MITIVEQDASWARVLKNEEHWKTIFDILSYNTITKDRYSNRIEEVTRSFFDKRGGKFGAGLLPYVTGKLDEMDIPYKISHEKFNKSMKIRKEISLDIEDSVEFDKVTLEKYQNKIIKFLDKGIKRGCIQSSTGSGKSYIAGAIIKKFDIPPSLIIVPTKSIANGFRKELQKLLSIPIGMLSGKEKSIEQVTIGLYQTVRNLNLKKINNDIKLIIVDEAHSSKCVSIQNILQELKDVWYRFGLSATLFPRSNKKNWFAVTSQLGEVIIKISDEEAIERVVPVEAYMVKFKTMTKRLNFQDTYRYDVLLNKERIIELLNLVEYALDEVDNCLLLVDEYEQAKAIKEYAEYYFDEKYDYLHPEIAWSGVKNLDDIANRLNSGKLKFVIATPVWKVGTNIPNVQSIILGSARKSPIDTIQKVGRGRRRVEGKDKLLLFDIYDIVYGNNKFEEFSKARMRIYKSKRWFKGFLGE